MLGVNLNSVKNMRDEFDPLHDNLRAGWYQRPLRPSRAKVVESFQHLSEEELRDVVLEILTNPEFVSSDDFSDVVTPIVERHTIQSQKSPTVLYKGPPQVLNPVGWGALNSEKVAETRVWRNSWGRKEVASSVPLL